LQSVAVNNDFLSDNLYYNGGWKYRANGYGELAYFNGGFGIWTAANNASGASATASPGIGLFVANGGSVGIGTRSPSYSLDVNGSAHATSLVAPGVIKQAAQSYEASFQTITTTSWVNLTSTRPVTSRLSSRRHRSSWPLSLDND
jgi:hypothetical protein